ncbi:fungal-specific transcription factor domain-containing protein [Xylariaceae sp. FL0016]|nr:fungal-specific transcription factor domain-containing protein [Xylariaceae sp. FL0016]
MAMPTEPTFLVFDSKVTSGHNDKGLIYCKVKDADVQWPKICKAKKLFSTPFSSVANSLGPFVRAHVMHKYWEQKKIDKQTNHEYQDVLVDSHSENPQRQTRVYETCLPQPERWRTDPFDCFPINMQPYMHELLLMFISAFTDELYTIEMYWGVNPAKTFWVPLSLTDAALMNSILYANSVLRAGWNPRKECVIGINHLQQTIQLLNKRLQDQQPSIDDATIGTVAGLALTECSCGHEDKWRIHMAGMKRMIDTRGGLSAFESQPFLYDKICRADLAGTFQQLSTPILQINDSETKSKVFENCEYIATGLSSGFRAVHEECSLDAGFIDVLRLVTIVTRELGAFKRLKSDMLPGLTRRRTRYIQYHILSRVSSSEESLITALKLGILLHVGIISNEFSKFPVSHRVTRELRSSLVKANFVGYVMQTLRLWILFLAGSVVGDPLEKQWVLTSIHDCLSRLSISSWEEARFTLEKFAWVGRLQNIGGESLWLETKSSTA